MHGTLVEERLDQVDALGGFEIFGQGVIPDPPTQGDEEHTTQGQLARQLHASLPRPWREKAPPTVTIQANASTIMKMV